MIKICQYDKSKLALLEVEFACTNNDFFITYSLYKLDYCLSLYKRYREEAYDKMMRWIGKMVKNNTTYRYDNNKVDHLYEPVISKDILDELRYALI